MLDAVSHAVNGAAIEVHRELGPSLLEALYERALAEEFRLRGIGFTRQKEVAAKYKGDKSAEDKLAQKIMKGGSGVWGQIPMPANPQVSAAEAKTLVKWILSLK